MAIRSGILESKGFRGIFRGTFPSRQIKISPKMEVDPMPKRIAPLTDTKVRKDQTGRKAAIAI
jgi:hypothetical protein